MTTIGMNYEIREGKEQPFEKKFARVLDAMSETTGHLATHLYKDVFKNRSYLVISEWTSKDAFDSFVASDIFKRVTDWGKAHILATRPAHKVYSDATEMTA